MCIRDSIIFLPQLATLFNVTVDELMGYEPQLTQEAIVELYHQLSDEIAHDSDEALKHCEELLHTYHACFPFLYKMIVLYLNHATLFKDPAKILDEALKLCHYVEKECKDPTLTKETLTLEIMAYIASDKPMDALQLLGEIPRPIAQDSELTAACHQKLGNMEQAYRILQTSAYQHLLFLIQDSISFMMLRIDDLTACEKTIAKVKSLLELYQISHIHPYTAFQSLLAIAQVYAHHHLYEEAFKELTHSADILATTNMDKLQNQDDYFTELNSWLKEIALDTQPPRNRTIVIESLLQIINELPEFQPMKNDPRFQHCIRTVSYTHLDVYKRQVQYPLPILKANQETLASIYQKVQTMEDVYFVDFTNIAQSCLDYDDYIQKMKKATQETIEYYGIALLGPKKSINRLSGSLPLLR